jgi:hypothetical protein
VNGSVVPIPPSPVNLATSIQLPDYANTIPDAIVDREKEKNSNGGRTALILSTYSTNNALLTELKRVFIKKP